MTGAEERSLERAVGRIEARLDAVAEDVKRANDKLDAADEWRHEVRQRLEKMEENDVSNAFRALEQSIRDGKNQARGVVIGVGLAAGAGGATFATFFKSIAAWVGNLFSGA